MEPNEHSTEDGWSPGNARFPGLSPGSVFEPRISEFTLWQLADSAFPTGGFAHSAGLEAAWQHGEVRGRQDLLSFTESSLQQLGRAALPFVTTAHGEPGRLDELDRLCDVFTTNHVANRASRAQGRALLSAAERIFGVRRQRDSAARLVDGTGTPPGSASPDEMPSNEAALHGPVQDAGEFPELPYAHVAPVFGAVMKSLWVPREVMLRLFFFNHLRGVFAAAVRLNIVGPMEAQSMQHRMTPRAEEIIDRCKTLTLDELAQSSPLLDLWQSAHDRLYSRLFQS